MFQTIYERILYEHEKLKNQISKIQSEINSLPKGKLQHQHNGNYHKWYCSDGKSRFYIPQNNKQLIERLALKNYLNELSIDLSNEALALSNYLDFHDTYQSNVEKLLNSNPQYQDYLSSYLNTTSNELSQWSNEAYDKNKAHPEHLIHKTNCGFYVRSKSEAIITMLLHNNQIPFRYECALSLNGITLYPDFTIRHPKTSILYYWEHFGKMDDPHYIKNASSKLDLYISNGIFPSVNLITTYETSTAPLDIELVENLINGYFLSSTGSASRTTS